MRIYELMGDSMGVCVNVSTHEEYVRLQGLLRAPRSAWPGHWPAPAMTMLEDQEEELAGGIPACFSWFGCPPVFRREAWEQLRPFLPVGLEGLPGTLLHVGDVVVPYCTVELDALDPARSKVAYFPDGAVLRVERHVFDPARIGGAMVFRDRLDSWTSPYIQEPVRQALLASGFKGWRAELVWTDEEDAAPVAPPPKPLRRPPPLRPFFSFRAPTMQEIEDLSKELATGVKLLRRHAKAAGFAPPPTPPRRLWVLPPATDWFHPTLDEAHAYVEKIDRTFQEARRQGRDLGEDGAALAMLYGACLCRILDGWQLCIDQESSAPYVVDPKGTTIVNLVGLWQRAEAGDPAFVLQKNLLVAGERPPHDPPWVLG